MAPICVKKVCDCVADRVSRYKEVTDEQAQGKEMTTQKEQPIFKDALEAFQAKVQGRLHAYVKEVHQGRPAISCLWNETPVKTLKEVVFIGDANFDALTVVKVVNKSMKASDQVVSMLIELYTSQNQMPVGDDVEY